MKRDPHKMQTNICRAVALGYASPSLDLRRTVRKHIANSILLRILDGPGDTLTPRDQNRLASLDCLVYRRKMTTPTWFHLTHRDYVTRRRVALQFLHNLVVNTPTVIYLRLLHKFRPVLLSKLILHCGELGHLYGMRGPRACAVPTCRDGRDGGQEGKEKTGMTLPAPTQG